MALPYPPILESHAVSRPTGQIPSAETFDIAFEVPRNLNALDSTSDRAIRHVQVLIRRQLTMVPWSVQSSGATVSGFSPDREVIYLRVPQDVAREDIQDGVIRVPRGALRHLRVGGSATNTQPGFNASANLENFDDAPGATLEGQVYTIQIRFGTNAINFDSNPAAFANWRAQGVANRSFGEWSNTQRMFVFAGTRENIFPAMQPFSGFLAGFSWEYNPVSHDPLAQAFLRFEYRTPDQEGLFVFNKSIPFESNIARGTPGAPTPISTGAWGANGEVDLDLGRVTLIHCHVDLITVNNTEFSRSLDIERFWTAVPTRRGNTEISQLLGEEVDDGAIAVEFRWDAATDLPAEIFRINTYNMEGLSLGSIPTGATAPYRIRDFSIEMGAEYSYVAINESGNPLSDVTHLVHTIDDIIQWAPQRYLGTARNLMFNANSFLMSRLQQLRLGGNVQVRNFNRVTSDQITQTIGGKYPFVSRAAQFDYRVLGISALISIRLDPTFTFLNLGAPDGRGEWYRQDRNFRRAYTTLRGDPAAATEVQLRLPDVFGEKNLSRNQSRIYPDAPRIAPTGNGPKAIFSPRRGQDVTMTIDTDPSVNIYAERKFRDRVMEWLTDGKPKLFRSETEGNMIVVLSGVGFTPLRDDRLVYTMSATLTEIAEYNLRNLRLYGLIPIDFSGTFAETDDFIASPTVIPSRQFKFIPSRVDVPEVIEIPEAEVGYVNSDYVVELEIVNRFNVPSSYELQCPDTPPALIAERQSPVLVVGATAWGDQGMTLDRTPRPGLGRLRLQPVAGLGIGEHRQIWWVYTIAGAGAGADIFENTIEIVFRVREAPE